MVNVNELRGVIAKNGLSQRKLAKKLGMTDTTFYKKMAKGVFGSDEIEKMIEILHIDNPMPIFFAK